MVDSTSAVRADIETTRARMSNAISELEKKADIPQKIRDNPWPALAIAFGAGLALSASGADARAGRASVDAAQKTGSKLGAALDDVLATTVGGVAAAFQSRIDDALKDLVASIKGTTSQKAHAVRQLGDTSGGPVAFSEGSGQIARSGITPRAD